MLRRITVIESGETNLLPGELRRPVPVPAGELRPPWQSRQSGLRPSDELMGITKASLATDSWLSAASFQETTRVLTRGSDGGQVAIRCWA